MSMKISLLALVTLSWAGVTEAAKCRVNATVAAGVAQARGYNIDVKPTYHAICQKIGAVGVRKSGPAAGWCIVEVFRRQLQNGWKVTDITTTGAKRSAPTRLNSGGLRFNFGEPLQDALVTMRSMTFERAGDVDCVNGWRQAFE